MTTFILAIVDESAGFKAERKYVVDDKEGERILCCYDGGKDYDKAFSAVADHMMKMLADHVCGCERACAAQPIIPKPE